MEMGDDHSPPTPSTSAAARKKEEKARKKDQRSWENIVKSMGDMPEVERIVVIQQKYVSIYNDLRRTTSIYQNLEKKFITLQKERDQVRAELNKNILAKAKLEGLCRELQKQNKAIKDENITRVKEEEEKRREVATNFTERLNSLSSMMDENKDKSVRLREENMNMTLKLTELYNKFQERESHLADVNRQLDAQKELFESKIKKMELEYKADRKAWKEECNALLSNLLKSNETNQLLEENIKSMQANLDVYKNQYSDFEQTMSRSNEVFKTFHVEINKLQKSNTALEKERAEYITKWKSCHNSVLEISEKNQQLAKKLEISEKKVATLEKLCRQLQTERTTLHKQLQDKIEPLLGSQNIDETNQISSIDAPKPVVQNPAPENLQNEELPNQSLNGNAKSTNCHRGEEYFSDEELVSSVHTSDEDYPPITYDDDQLPEFLPITDSEFEQGGDPGEAVVAQLSSVMSDTDYMSTAVLSDRAPCCSTTIFIKDAKSVPITKLDYKALEFKECTVSLTQCSSGMLREDDSDETLPLYKPAALTDVPTQGGHITLLKEAEGCTDMLKSSSSSDSELNLQTVPTDSPGSSTTTIELKESEGKTEIKKE